MSEWYCAYVSVRMVAAARAGKLVILLVSFLLLAGGLTAPIRKGMQGSS